MGAEEGPCCAAGKIRMDAKSPGIAGMSGPEADREGDQETKVTSWVSKLSGSMIDRSKLMSDGSATW